jgi:hypothetical protein
MQYKQSRKALETKQQISIVSQQYVNRASSRHGKHPDRQTQASHIARNEMDMHADTCCARSNWSVLEYTGELCKVTPFLSSDEPVTEIPISRCCTVWTDQRDSSEYLLVGDQMLWFGRSLPHSLSNLNQLRAYGLLINDDPFDHKCDFGIE